MLSNLYEKINWIQCWCYDSAISSLLLAAGNCYLWVCFGTIFWTVRRAILIAACFESWYLWVPSLFGREAKVVWSFLKSNSGFASFNTIAPPLGLLSFTSCTAIGPALSLSPSPPLFTSLAAAFRGPSFSALSLTRSSSQCESLYHYGVRFSNPSASHAPHLTFPSALA